MAAKRDQNSMSFRVSRSEDVWMRAKAAKFEMDVSEWIRKCIAIGAPVLDGIPFARRIELKDAMDGKDIQ